MAEPQHFVPVVGVEARRVALVGPVARHRVVVHRDALEEPPGVAAAPQLLGILVDKIAVSEFALTRSAATGASAEEIGMKIAMLIAALFPILGTAVVIVIRRKLKKVK